MKKHRVDGHLSISLINNVNHQPANLVWLRYPSSEYRITRFVDESNEVCGTFTGMYRMGGPNNRTGADGIQKEVKHNDW